MDDIKSAWQVMAWLYFALAVISLAFANIASLFLPSDTPDRNGRIANLWLSSIGYSILGIFCYLLLKL